MDRCHVECSVLYLIFSLLIILYLPIPIINMEKHHCINNVVIVSRAR